MKVEQSSLQSKTSSNPCDGDQASKNLIREKDSICLKLICWIKKLLVVAILCTIFKKMTTLLPNNERNSMIRPRVVFFFRK